MRRGLAALAAAAAVTLLGGCVSPALTGGQYTGKATLAVEAASSEVATGALVAENQLRGSVWGTYADTVITQSESALGGISASFGAVQPPSPQDDYTRDAVLAALSDSEDALAHARIAVRRSDEAGLRAAVAELHAAAATLDHLKGELA